MTRIPDEAFAHHSIFLGKTRAGKSSAMRTVVERLLDQKRPVGIIDPKGDWWGLKSSADGKKPGYEIVIFGGEHADVPIDEHSGAHVAELVATGNRPFIIDLGGWMVGARTRFYIAFASTLFKLTRGPRWLVIDECHNFAPQGKVHDPDAGKMVHWSNRLASEGAGKGMTLLSASQRPQKVHKDYVTSHETLVAMRVIHILDRNAAKDWLDGAPDKTLGKQVLDELASLARGEAWVWCPEIGFGPVRLQFPMFKTYDSFAVQPATVTKLKGWASVDLDDVRTKLASVVEKEQANDPAKLKARVLELEKLIAGRAAAAAANSGPPDTAEIQRLSARMEQLQAEVEKSRPAVAAMKMMGPAISDAGRKLQGVVTALGGLDDALDQILKIAESVDLDAMPKPAPLKSVPAPPVIRDEPDKYRSTERVDVGSIDTSITNPRRLILDKIAWARVFFNESSVERGVLGFLIGKHKRTKSFLNDLSGLKTGGFIELLSGERVGLTPAGEAIAANPGAPSREELIAGVKTQLSNRQCEILDEALGRGQCFLTGNALERQALADRFGLHVRTKSFLNDLSRMKTLGLIYYSGTAIAAADFLRER